MRRRRPVRHGLAATWIIGLSLWSSQVATQEGQKPKVEQNPLIVRGTVEDYMGAPIRGVTIEAGAWGAGDGDCTATSDDHGAFTLECSPLAGDLKVKFEMPGCGAAIRRFPPDARRDGMVTLKIILQCGDTVVPIKPHKKSPGVSYDAYVGTYRMASTFREGRRVEGQVTLSATSETAEHKCLCRKEWKLAITDDGDGHKGYGCWRVREDGDLQVSFPCEGLAFAGHDWTLWKEGNVLTGQGSSWSDTGVGSHWELTLIPMRHT